MSTNPYTYYDNEGYEYFVQHIGGRVTAGYGVFDEAMHRIDNNKPFADGFETAEEAQDLLDQIAAERGWVKP